MNDTQRLLRLRRQMNQKRPKFLHQEHWKLKRFRKAPWRKPKGKRSKMRAKERAKPSVVSIGYRGPRNVRGYHPKGVPEVLVHTAEEVEHVGTEAVVKIASSVGVRKKIAIVKRASEKNIYVANPRIPFAKFSSKEELDSLLPIRKYIEAWHISEKIPEEEREELEESAEEAGIEVVE